MVDTFPLPCISASCLVDFVTLLTITFLLTITCLQTSPVCSAEVTVSGVHPNITIGRNSVSFTSQDLILGRSYNVTVLATNFGGSATSQTYIREFVL